MRSTTVERRAPHSFRCLGGPRLDALAHTGAGCRAGGGSPCTSTAVWDRRSCRLRADAHERCDGAHSGGGVCAAAATARGAKMGKLLKTCSQGQRQARLVRTRQGSIRRGPKLECQHRGFAPGPLLTAPPSPFPKGEKNASLPCTSSAMPSGVISEGMASCARSCCRLRRFRGAKFFV